MIKAFWYKSKNIGDTLTPILLREILKEDVEFVDRNYQGKFLGVGSIMTALRKNDIVWGTGCIRDIPYMVNYPCNFLAVRGKLTEELLGVKIGVYGDPALLLPLFYRPTIEVKNTIGVIAHYVEKNEPFFKRLKADGVKVIDVEQDYKTFVDEVLSCEQIISSSLHGIIIAEAYGIPAKWVIVTDKVIGNGFKFRDYLSGTNRELPKPFIPEKMTDFKKLYHFPKIENLKEIQEKLISSLQNYYL
ncbi:MAG: polysaccharide pyruvyl transferase family protein [Patescibacteria group bacterium]